jgi:hypothetical protein
MREVRRIAPERLIPRDRRPNPLASGKLKAAFQQQLARKGYSAEQVKEIIGVLRETIEKVDGVDGHADAPPEIGDQIEDGTIYAGISPDTGQPLYALPSDAALTLTWEKAMKYAADLEAHGHPPGSFRLPTAGELNVLYENRDKGALSGTFDTRSGTFDTNANWYWSSSEYNGNGAWIQRFSDGIQDYSGKNFSYLVRCVRQ